MCKPDEHIQLENIVNKGLCRLKKFLDANRLIINVVKCELMFISTYQAPL